jgi:hypothetical protein
MSRGDIYFAHASRARAHNILNSVFACICWSDSYRQRNIDEHVCLYIIYMCVWRNRPNYSSSYAHVVVLQKKLQSGKGIFRYFFKYLYIFYDTVNMCCIYIKIYRTTSALISYCFRENCSWIPRCQINNYIILVVRWVSLGSQIDTKYPSSGTT